MNGVWWAAIGLIALTSVILRHNLLFLTSLLMALVGVASELWARYCLAGVTYRREFGSTHLFHGEETELAIEIVNAKPLPLPWLRVDDGFPAEVELLTGRLHPSHLPRRWQLINVLSMRWYERVTRRYRLRGARRGAWQFGPAHMSSGDLFGLKRRGQEAAGGQFLIVYPKIVPITQLGLPAHHPFGDFGAPRTVMEDPMRIVGAREYAPGDSFRHIHWKATARRHKGRYGRGLQTKVFEPSATRPLAIFLNINTFVRRYEGIDSELQEFAITVAASVARRAWEDRHPVGLYVNTVGQPGGGRIRITPGSHADQLNWILEALAKTINYGPWSLDRVIQLESSGLRYGSTLVVITSAINQELNLVLAGLVKRGYGVVLLTLGPARLETALHGVRHYHLGEREAWRELEALELG